MRLVGVLSLGLLLAPLCLQPSGSSASRIATGAYLPGVEKDAGVIDAYAAKVGRPPLIVGVYRNWEQWPVDASHLDPIAAQGAVPMITWEPWLRSEAGISLWSIAAGGHDSYLAAAARGAADWGGPAFFRFGHEMNGGWYPWGWGVAGNTPAAFKAAWRHVVAVFRAHGATNVRWVWCPYASNVRPRQFKRFYPGDRWVDWGCLDGFNWGSYRSWQSFRTVFGRSYRAMTRVTSRPLMIGEIGVNEAGGNKPRWIARSLSRLHDYRHVRALVWFNAADSRADFRVDSSGRSLAAIRNAFRRKLFSTNLAALLNLPPRLGRPHRQPGPHGHGGGQ